MLPGMIAQGPRLRATHSRATLSAVERVQFGGSYRVLARLPAEIRDGLTGALKGTFIPVAWDLALVRAIREELGEEQLRRVSREMMSASLRGPLLGGLVRGAQALFGITPNALFHWAGNAWSHVTRECGTLALEAEEPAAAVLRFEAMPSELTEPDYLAAVGATLSAVFVICGVEGRVELIDARPDGARFRAEWG
jgi:hypothetical protein